MKKMLNDEFSFTLKFNNLPDFNDYYIENNIYYNLYIPILDLLELSIDLIDTENLNKLVKL